MTLYCLRAESQKIHHTLVMTFFQVVIRSPLWRFTDGRGKMRQSVGPAEAQSAFAWLPRCDVRNLKRRGQLGTQEVDVSN